MPSAVAACIITYRRPQGLGKLLAHLARQELGTEDLLVVVVDNDPEGSARVVTEAAKEGGLRLVYDAEPTPGIPRARNRSVGAALSHGSEYLCFVDDDEFPAVEWLSRLLAHAATTCAPVVTGPVLSILPPEAPAWAARSQIFSRPRFPTGERREYAATNNVLVHRGVFESIHPWFDESMPLTGGTDTDFFKRAHAAGFAIEWCDEAIVYEDVPIERCDLRWIRRRNLRVGLGVARRARRFEGTPGFAKAVRGGAICVARGLLLLGGATLGGDPEKRLRLIELLSYGSGLMLGGFGITVDEYRRPGGGSHSNRRST